MIWSPVAALVRGCVRFTRRRVAAPPAEPPRLTMEQVAILLRPRAPVVRRAVALGCPAAALPTVAIPPAVPLPVPPAPLAAPLPFGIGAGPLLPDALPLYGAPSIPGHIAEAAAAVPEPGTLALLIVAALVLIAVRSA